MIRAATTPQQRREPKPWRCPSDDCQYGGTDKKRELRRHFLERHSNVFVDDGNHQQLAGVSRPWLCPGEDCEFQTEEEQAFWQHLSSAHRDWYDESLQECVPCNYSTTRADNFRRHERTHYS